MLEGLWTAQRRVLARRVVEPPPGSTRILQRSEEKSFRSNNPGPIELIFLHWWVGGNELDGDEWRASSLAFWERADGKDVHPPDLSVNQRHNDKRTLNSGRVVTKSTSC